MRFRFTLSHDELGSEEIDEPGGWDEAKIILDRDEMWSSLIERYEGMGSDGNFIFYGDNGIANGGLNFIESVEDNYGPDSEVRATIEYAPNDTDFEQLFEGLVNIFDKNRTVNNQVDIPIQRADTWAKFINRLDTPVNLSDLVDIDGNAVTAVLPIECNLTDQYINQYFVGFLPESVYNFTGGLGANDYVQIDFDDTNPGMYEDQRAATIDEIDEHIGGYPVIDNPEQPAPIFQFKFPGDVVVNNLTIIAYKFGDTTNPVDPDIKGYIFDGVTEYELTRTDYLGSDAVSMRTRFEYSGTIADARTIAVYLKNDSGSTSTAVGILFDDQTEIGVPGTYTTKFDFYIKTKYQETRAEGYLIHDAFFGVLQRIGLGNSPFYSEILGSGLTTTIQYDEDGCGWAYSLFKGLQVRQYTLSEKPFYISFKQLWDGINPILNLGLTMETVDDSPDQVRIRIESKEDYFDATSTSVNFSNVQNISSTYDDSRIFKTIKTGYKKWQSETASGIDDPQTKATRATQLKYAGSDITLESEFIAAGLAIESTRRAKREKNKDHKFDNDTFIIALNTDDISPDVYAPELDENFDSVTNLLNPERRYNLTLTPLRNFLRWSKVFNGSLYWYQDSVYKFTAGEGNSEMVSNYSCVSGRQCIGIICDELAENGEIDLSIYYDSLGYLFIPELFEIVINMEWDEFQLIRNNLTLPIGISQSGSNHVKFFIKKLEYEIVQGRANIQAWMHAPMRISVADSVGVQRICPAVDTCYRITEDGDIRITESGDRRILEEC